IQKMMVGGGGTLNWSFIQNGLADEVSMILAPIANADPEGHRFFVAKEPYSTIQETAFQLKVVEELEHGTLWIRYAVKNDGEKYNNNKRVDRIKNIQGKVMVMTKASGRIGRQGAAIKLYN